MSFFPDGTIKAKSYNKPNPLVPVVRPLPVAARQAMYAQVKKGTIARGTWANCAWNAAGKEVGERVNSFSSAAAVFGCSEKIVSDFIRRWDNIRGTDTTANTMLLSALEEVGFDEVKIDPGLTRVVVGFAFKGTATEFLEKLEEVTDLSDLGFDCELMSEVSNLLNA